MTDDAGLINDSQPKRPGGGKVYAALQTVAELLITAGVVILLFVVYELYVTDLESARKQETASAELDKRWSAKPRERREPEEHVVPEVGEAFTRLYIPRFGEDYRFSVVEGVGQKELAVGPGHYPNTALPGMPGNFGVAGHRIGKGAPFNDLDQLQACDAILVETATDFFVYRVMPMREQIVGWARAQGGDQRCTQVSTLRTKDGDGGPYRETFGRKIVTPDRGDAVAPIPYQAGANLPKSRQAALLTLTTCHPEFSNRERMIIHAVLTRQVGKSPGDSYHKLLRELGER